MLLCVVERCPLYGGMICYTVFWDENICQLFRGVRCIQVAFNESSTVANCLFDDLACCQTKQINGVFR